MPMTCTICRHPQRHEIEQAMVSRASYRRIAAHFGVGYRSVGRHMDCLRRCVRAVLAERKSDSLTHGSGT